MSPGSYVLAAAAVAAFIGVCVWLAASVERAPVARTRVEQFARRHDLLITPANGNRVIGYLATTRRWRTVGLACGLLASIGWAVAHSGLGVDALTLFAGWFVGALVAEVRLASLTSGPRRAALLLPRVPAAYLPRFAWALLPAAALVSVAVGAATAIAALGGTDVDAAALVWFGAAITVAVVVRVVQLRVLRRPQPVAEPDVLAADDAIRSRSLHVLAGGGASLVLYCVLGQAAALATLLPAGVLPAAGALPVQAAAVVGIPLLGWLVATARWPIRRSAGPAGALPANEAS
ncbi:MAG TPA: hypothetical protein VFR67_14305 [Pilimelia sp.]|nr:hypothetical protein [Pilimelia sp.]